jgi:hypothetical protein
MNPHRKLVPKPMMITPGINRHFKGGFYQVLGLTRHSETSEQFVVYQQLGRDETWIRPYQMFIETISQDGANEPRFSKVADSVEEIAHQTSSKASWVKTATHFIEEGGTRLRALMPLRRQQARR